MCVCVVPGPWHPVIPPGLSSMTANHYFIITEKPEYYSHINLGNICYISEQRFKRQKSSSKLPVFPFSTSSCLDYDIERKCLSALPVKSAELLLALPDDAERLKWFREGAALQTALGLTSGTAVIVQAGEEELRGNIRYIGRLTKSQNPLSATFLGIELQVRQHMFLLSLTDICLSISEAAFSWILHILLWIFSQNSSS